MKLSLLILILVGACSAATIAAEDPGQHVATSEDIRFPDWAFATIRGLEAGWEHAGMVDVKQAPYNAVGDDKADDTAALNLAFKTLRNGTIYLPAGVYRVSGTIDWQGWAMRNLHGAGRERTIIKFDDRAAGFGDPGKPQPLIRMAGSLDGANSLGSTSFMNSLYWDGDRLKPGGGGFIANSVMWTAYVDPGKAKD